MRLVPKSVGVVRFDWSKSLWLWSMLFIGVFFGLPALTPRLTLLSASLALITLCLGHSVGLHRGVIHRTYETSPLVRGLLAELFVLTGLGGPLSWARLHAVRDHWQKQAECPPYFAYRHSMPRDFFWNLHLRFIASDARAERRLPPDVLNDPWLTFLEHTWPLHVLGSALLLAWLGGPDAVAVCIGLRVAGGILGHWAIGYATHVWGERLHLIEGASESGTNLWLLGVISFGEGFHNNHHAHPHSARMGLKWFEFDLGWYAVSLMRVLGLIRMTAPGPAFRPVAAPS